MSPLSECFFQEAKKSLIPYISVVKYRGEMFVSLQCIELGIENKQASQEHSCVLIVDNKHLFELFLFVATALKIFESSLLKIIV